MAPIPIGGLTQCREAPRRLGRAHSRATFHVLRPGTSRPCLERCHGRFSAPGHLRQSHPNSVVRPNGCRGVAVIGVRAGTRRGTGAGRAGWELGTGRTAETGREGPAGREAERGRTKVDADPRAGAWNGWSAGTLETAREAGSWGRRRLRAARGRNMKAAARTNPIRRGNLIDAIAWTPGAGPARTGTRRSPGSHRSARVGRDARLPSVAWSVERAAADSGRRGRRIPGGRSRSGSSCPPSRPCRICFSTLVDSAGFLRIAGNRRCVRTPEFRIVRRGPYSEPGAGGTFPDHARSEADGRRTGLGGARSARGGPPSLGSGRRSEPALRMRTPTRNRPTGPPFARGRNGPRGQRPAGVSTGGLAIDHRF